MIWREKAGVVFESSPLLGTAHGFTTRLGGVSGGALASMNLGFGRGDTFEIVAENYARLGQAIGFDPACVSLSRQVHGNEVRCITEADVLGLEAPRSDCDALITDRTGTALVIFTADCIPVLLYDPVRGAVGAAHCGWRGTALGTAARTVRAMQEAYGCDPAQIRAAIGPGIGGCCFETDADVPAAMREALGETAEAYMWREGDKWHVDLKAINDCWLRRAGLRQIDRSGSCTACDLEHFWSHRRMGLQRGSQAAVIVCGGAGV